MVFLNLSYSYSLIPYLLFFGVHRFICGFAIVLLNTLYSMIYFRGSFRIGNNKLVYLIILLNLFNFISSYLTDTGWQSALAYTIVSISFYMLLCNIYRDYKIQGYLFRDRLYFLFRGYLGLVVLNILSCAVLYVLVSIGVSVHVNSVDNSYDLFSSNVEKLGASYYFPYHLGIVNYSPAELRIPFFQNQGFIVGFYHEPHTITFMLFPALFIMLYYYKSKRIVLILAFTLIMLLAGSTTNILSLLVVLFIYVFYLLKSNIKMSIVVLVLVSLISYLGYRYIDASVYGFIFNKLDSTSSGYSQNLIEYAFTPKTFWGTNCFDTSEMTSFGNAANKDVGVVKFFINFVFLIYIYFCTIKLYFKKERFILPVLLFVSYFLLHSTKIAMSTYSLTLLIFVCFVLQICNNPKEYSHGY